MRLVFVKEAMSDKLELKKRQINLAGQRFGSLTVLEPAEKRGGQKYWKCRCDCGKETIVRQSYLKSGKTKSCGCLRTKTALENLQIVDGTSIAVLRRTEDRLVKSNTSGYNGVYWNRKNAKWVAQITFRGKTHYLGGYLNIEDAVRARKEAEKRMYGRFLQQYDAEQK